MQDPQAEKGSAVVITVIVLAIVGIAAFLFIDGRKAHAPSTLTEIAKVTPTPSGKTVPEDLTFTGVVTGHMTQGEKGDTYVCLPATTGPIVGKIGDKDYTFEYRSMNANGAGTYKAYVQIGPVDNKDLYFGSSDVNLVINADKRSGSVDGTLVNLKDNSQSVKITGKWTCPPDF